MPERILLHGCYANRNFGDLLMLDMLTMRIRKAFNVTPVCPWVRRDRRKFVAAKSGHGLVDCLFADAAIFGGGGYIDHKAGTSLKGLRRYSTPRGSGMPGLSRTPLSALARGPKFPRRDAIMCATSSTGPG